MDLIHLKEGTVHDTENLTFPKNSVVVPHRHPWIVLWNGTDLPHWCRESSTRVDTDSVQADADFQWGRAQIFNADSG